MLRGWPRVRFLSTTNLNQNYQHSILISLLRGLAAVEVAAAHLRAQLFPSLRLLPDPTLWYQVFAFFTGFGHQAVVLFFVLSGWLVGGSLLNKVIGPKAMISYAIDRFTRLWVVLIPAFVLTLLIGTSTESVDPSQICYSRENEYSATSFVGNLFGLQDMVVPRFGGNFSLWSLANEIWYYVLFPLLLLPFISRSTFTQAGASLTGAALAYCLSFEIVLYFLIWLLGVAFSRIKIDCSRLHRAGLVALLICVSVYYRLTGSNDTLVAESFIQDLVFSLAFLTLLSSLQIRADPQRIGTRLATAIGNWFAQFSFTLYVVHVPLIGLLRHAHAPLAEQLSPAAAGDLAVYGIALAVIVLLAYALYLPFEAQTYRLRRLIKRVAFGTATQGGRVVT
jgi:peptidoglycan/LPS O-acetylase OafA/YrhL